MERFTIKFDNLSTVQDFSDEAENYIRDTFEIYQESTEVFYVGYRKPFNSFFTELSQVSSTVEPLTVEYWNGTAYTAVPGLSDKTRGYSRSGFVDFSREITDWAKNTVDSVELYWVRVSASSLLNNPQIQTKAGNSTTRLGIEDADISKLSVGDTIIFDTTLDGLQVVVITAKDDTAGTAYVDFLPATANAVDDNTDVFKPLIINGVNILFSSDIDIVEEVPYIDGNINYLPRGFTSYVPYHQAARKTLIQELRNKGKAKINNKEFNTSNNFWSNLTQFDILDRTELAEAAKQKVLEILFFNTSDEADDKFEQKSKEHRSKYADAFSLAFLSLDTNDDGIVTQGEGENLTKQVTRIRRL